MPKPRTDRAKDNRFAAIGSDPRFQLPRKKSIRGEVDSRFKDALTSDDRFSKKAHIDKYGRRVKQKDPKKELSRYYNFEEDEDAKEEKSNSSSSDSGEEDLDESSDEEEEAEPVKTHTRGSQSSQAGKRKPTMRELMRGEGIEDLESDSDSDSDADSGSESSDSDSSSDDDALETAKTEDEYEVVRSAASAIPQGEESKRLAVVNLDWDNVTSTDLMATFSSFVPPNNRINSVKIYLSEFGKKQIAEEELHGPPQELFDNGKKKAKDAKREETDDPKYDDDKDYSSSKLRKYQLQRLQYYYAVVDCDSSATAATIYSSCDGAEYESTANFFDLRFVPDEVDFDGDTPRDECYKVPANYQPSNFTTDALQHSKVKLTWDENPRERAQLAQKAFATKDVENEDLKAYLASDSDSEDEETVAQRYRALLGDSNAPSKSDAGAQGSDSDSDAVEITFNPVLEGKEAKLEIVDRDSKPSQEGADPEENLSTIERYRLKEKQRRLRRLENYKNRKAAEAEQQKSASDTNRAELELLSMDDNLLDKAAAGKGQEEQQKSSAKPGKKLTKRATKKKALEEAEQDFDTADPRFQALFEDPDFAIDSTLPQYKQTKGMERIISERRKRQDNSQSSDKPTKSSKRKPENSGLEDTRQLVSKLRRKTQGAH